VYPEFPKIKLPIKSGGVTDSRSEPSFDGGKPIALRWDGGDAFINLDLKPGSLVLQFLAKLEGSKTLTISYPISDCPMKTIDLYGSPMQVQDCPVRIVDIGGSKVPVRGCVHCPQKSATFELIGTEAALSSICPADGCQMLK
jgi:hypothetical protein